MPLFWHSYSWLLFTEAHQYHWEHKRNSQMPAHSRKVFCKDASEGKRARRQHCMFFWLLNFEPFSDLSDRKPVFLTWIFFSWIIQIRLQSQDVHPCHNWSSFGQINKQYAESLKKLLCQKQSWETLVMQQASGICRIAILYLLATSQPLGHLQVTQKLLTIGCKCTDWKQRSRTYVTPQFLKSHLSPQWLNALIRINKLLTSAWNRSDVYIK